MSTFIVGALRKLVKALALAAGLSLLAAVLITTVDVVLRKFGHPITGAYDLVKIATGIAIACGLPYTTAVKGHAAVEFFYHKLGRRGRIVADSTLRAIIFAMFTLFTWGLADYGASLKRAGQVSQTLQLPVFWVPYVMAFCCVVVAPVTIYHLLHPGKALLKP